MARATWALSCVGLLLHAAPASADPDSIVDRASQYQRMADWLRRPEESLRAASDFAGFFQTAAWAHLDVLFYLAALVGLSVSLIGMFISPRDFNPAKVLVFFFVAFISLYPVPYPADRGLSNVTHDLMQVDGQLSEPSGGRSAAFGFMVMDSVMTTAHQYIIEMVSAITAGRIGDEKFGTSALGQMSTLTTQNLADHMAAAPELIYMLHDYDRHCQKVGQFAEGDSSWGGNVPLAEEEMIMAGFSGDTRGFIEGGFESALSGSAQRTMQHARFNAFNLPDAEIRGYTVPSADFWLSQFRYETGAVQPQADVPRHLMVDRPQEFIADPSTTVHPLRQRVDRELVWQPTNCWQLYETVVQAMTNYWKAFYTVYESEDPDELASRREAAQQFAHCRPSPGHGGCSLSESMSHLSALGTQNRFIQEARSAFDEYPASPGARDPGLELAYFAVTSVGERLQTLTNRISLSFAIPLAISLAAGGYLLAGVLFPFISILAIIPGQHDKFWITLQLMAFLQITMLLLFIVLEVGGWAWYLLMSIGSHSGDYSESFMRHYALLGVSLELGIYIGAASSVYLAFMLVTSNVYGAAMGLMKSAAAGGPGAVAGKAGIAARTAGRVATGVTGSTTRVLNAASGGPGGPGLRRGINSMAVNSTRGNTTPRSGNFKVANSARGAAERERSKSD